MMRFPTPFFCLLVLTVLSCATFTALAAEKDESTHLDEEEEEEELEPVDALLFPWFMAVIGAVLFFVLSRAIKWLPYTAGMFLIGTIIGIAVSHFYKEHPNLLQESIVQYWMKIDGELLLVGFLPGLIFSDASSQRTHLFQVAFGQCLIFAFPMVLAGTVLTALVAYYIFPYNWSFALSMTFGSILAATDPVAVAALLNEVGAPPRLKVHIAGESLLNDGSAIVFYTIFSSMFLLELDVPGLGEDFSFGQGVSRFFQMAAGGAAVGIFFGLGLLGILRLFDQRLNREENVTEVALTAAMAYVCYFTAEVAWGTSGVISVVVLGVMTTAFGRSFINDFKLLEDFWSLVEWLLNTVLFALGGLVWGSVISNNNPETPDLQFTSRDWGYLFVLYFLLAVIRFALFAFAYPIYSRIGLKSNVKEMLFQSFGGLRGAVGIALALSLNDGVIQEIESNMDVRFAIQVNKLFGLIGGIAFLSLCVNAVVAGPLLRKLGLANPTDIRKRMLECYREHARQHAIDELVRLLSEERFQSISYVVVRHHVPVLLDVSLDEFIDAAEKLYKTDETKKADLKGVIPYLDSPSSTTEEEAEKGDSGEEGTPQRHTPIYQSKDASSQNEERDKESRHRMSQIQRRQSQVASASTLQELRHLFLELVKAQYDHQISNGELVDHEFVSYTLHHAMDIAYDRVSQGEPIHDWDFADIVQIPLRKILGKLVHLVKDVLGFEKAFQRVFGELSKSDHPNHMTNRIGVERCLAFIHAHVRAQSFMQEQFAHDRELGQAEIQVIAESNEQVEKAEATLANFPLKQVEIIVSHKVCKIILQHVAEFTEDLVHSGLLKHQEAEEMLSKIQDALTSVESCIGGCVYDDEPTHDKHHHG